MRSRSWTHRIVTFLGLKKNMLVLLAMVILVGLGEKMAERFLPLYLMALGGGAISVGLLNGMDNLLSSLYSYPGGYASDRLGYKRALILFNAIAMLGYWFVFQLIAGLPSLSGPGGGVAFWAHVGGFACGFLLAPLFQRPRKEWV